MILAFCDALSRTQHHLISHSGFKCVRPDISVIHKCNNHNNDDANNYGRH